MPPKKNATKTNAANTASESSSATGKNTMKVEASTLASTRTLRPRKPSASTVTEPDVPKATKTKSKEDSNGVTKTKSKEDANGVVVPAKRNATGRGKRGKAEEKPEEQSASKISKVEDEQEQDKNNVPISASSIFAFKANTIEGKEISLSKYKGHVCIIVNVASKCGHTPSNYKEFVELYDKFSGDKGLRILAFPCNQFGKQEPGDNEKICEFAKKKNVKFDMFEKIDVNGENAHPLWKYLTSQKEGPKGAEIDWNFTKFLINKEGQVVERFKSTIKPLALVKELEKLL